MQNSTNNMEQKLNQIYNSPNMPGYFEAEKNLTN